MTENPGIPAGAGVTTKASQFQAKKKQGLMTLLFKHFPLEKIAAVSASSTR
jgi:hypothetical protein